MLVSKRGTSFPGRELSSTRANTPSANPFSVVYVRKPQDPARLAGPTDGALTSREGGCSSPIVVFFGGFFT